MNTVEFLTAILPLQGHSVIVTGPHPVTGKPGVTTMYHHVAKDLAEAASFANKRKNQFNVYFAVHTMREVFQKTRMDGKQYPDVSRTANNAAFVQCFYLDLDVGPEAHKYASQVEALAALKDFRKAVKLPVPMVVNSGRGVHAYWRFTEAVASADWKPAAEILKRLTVYHGLKADVQITADAARILRVVGTWNHKDAAKPLPVELWHSGSAPTAFSDLVTILDCASADLPASEAPRGPAGAIKPPAAMPETPENVAVVTAMLTAIDPDIGRDDWRNAVWGVAALGWSCGEALAHEWSRGDLHGREAKKWEEAKFTKAWDSFDPSRAVGIGVGSLIYLARQSGYAGPDLLNGDLSSASFINSGAAAGDIVNGRRFATELRGRLLYIYDSNDWLRFDPASGWLSMPLVEVEAAAKAIVDEMSREAAERWRKQRDDPAAKKMLQNVERTSRLPHMRAMIDMAKSEPGMAASLADFDADPWLLGVRNGVLDLRTGGRRDFAPELRVSKRAAVELNAAAVCPLWDAFLERVLPNQEVRAFLCRWAGYCLTGDVGAHKWVFLSGSGANGKSVFTETLAHLMGDYAHPLATEVLMDDPRGGRNHDPDIMALQGKRLAFATETEENQRLAPARVKRLTGGDTLSGRRPYSKAPESFRPSHKLMGSGNHRPTIPDTSPGTWRRVAIVDFEVEIPELERDPDLAAKLRDEAPGILNWALAGLVDFKAGGLRPPPAVSAATDDYRRDEDVLGQFVAECCETGQSFKVGGADLYAAYVRWCADNGRKHVPTKHMLTKQLRARRVTVSRDGGTYFGIQRLGVTVAGSASPDRGS